MAGGERNILYLENEGSYFLTVQTASFSVEYIFSYGLFWGYHDGALPVSVKGQSNPLADIFQKSGHSDEIAVGRATTILTPLWLLGKPASVLQVSQGSLNGGAGQV